jgi:hypothetical protein
VSAEKFLPRSRTRLPGKWLIGGQGFEQLLAVIDVSLRIGGGNGMIQ